MERSYLVFMQEMTWREYVDRIRQGAVVILPCGALEQHGPHLPLETDELIARRIAEEVAGHVGAIVAPSIVYGAKSQALTGGGQVFPGTTSLDGQTLIFLVRDIVRELLRHGARKIVLLNGHGENTAFLYEGVDLALSEKGPAEVKVLVVNWWDLVSERTLDRVFPEGFPGWDLEHAAVIETSLVYALAPELVWREVITDEELEFIPRYTIFPQPQNLVPESGLLSKVSPASREKGVMLFKEVQQALLDVLDCEFS
ncbi:MAG: creatininase [Chloroflexi bacterium]|nr:creatininase [Chloroflexota bacterium]